MTPPPEGTEELRECPFCGSDEIKKWRDRDHFWSVQCLSCGASLLRATEVSATTDWNRRTSVAPAEPATNPSPNSTELVARSETPTAGIGEK